VLGTRGHAAIATNAAAGAKRNFRPKVLSFRILAEHATQGAALEKYDTADARTILQAVAFDVNNERMSH
jgi:hypothetical protein